MPPELHRDVRASRRAFTLIELMVVVCVLAILAGAVVVIRGSTFDGSGKRSTRATLETLRKLMEDYLAAGNPEPVPETYAEWSYGVAGAYNTIYLGNPPPPAAYLPTSPASDPIRWVKAFRASPEFRQKLEAMKTAMDIEVRPGTSLPFQTRRETGNPGTNMMVLDSWGTPIRYVPAKRDASGNVTTPGYFWSAGTDGEFFGVPANIYASPSYAPAQNKNDDVFSTSAP